MIADVLSNIKENNHKDNQFMGIKLPETQSPSKKRNALVTSLELSIGSDDCLLSGEQFVHLQQYPIKIVSNIHLIQTLAFIQLNSYQNYIKTTLPIHLERLNVNTIAGFSENGEQTVSLWSHLSFSLSRMAQ